MAASPPPYAKALKPDGYYEELDILMSEKVSIPVRREFLDKQECLKEARKLLREGALRGMNEKQIARELYSHAVVFYFCERTGRFAFLKKHASPIDMRDGGDILPSRIAFAACWFLRRY